MLGALEVELVGTKDAVGILLVIFGPLLIASAAVIAALVARKTANERQAEQLAHDTKRQKEQLAHDTERQERQLAHDRDMRDRDYLFRTVSRAYEHLEEAKRAVIRVGGLVGSLESTRTVLGEAREAREPARISYFSGRMENYEEQVRDAMDQAHDATLQLWADTARLRLFLGQEDMVVSSHQEMADSMRNWYDAVKVGYYHGNRDEGEVEKSEMAADEARTSHWQFEDACRLAFGWSAQAH